MTLKPEHIVEALNKKTFDEIDPDEVLKHYGYKPEEVRCNGVGIGVWRKEESFQKLGDIGAYLLFAFVVCVRLSPGCFRGGGIGSLFVVRPVKVSGAAFMPECCKSR